MRFYLSESCALKNLETPSVYDIRADELYELDDEAFWFISKCAGSEGADPSSADKDFIDYCVSEGIITDKKPHSIKSKRPLIKQSPVPSLRYLELQITDRCNLKCRHCYLGDTSSKELPLESVMQTIKEFEEMQGLRLLVTGGEPLMHSCFEELNNALTEFSVRKILFTNGLLLTKDKLSRLNFDEVQFSIDGMQKGHDALRGSGTYVRVIENLEAALDSGIDVSVATMVHKANLDEFDDMRALFESIKLKDWTVDVPCAAGNLSRNEHLYVTPDEAGKYFSYGFSSGMHGSSSGYACGLHLASVLSDGTVAKCAFYRDIPAGKAVDGLAACWQKIAPIKLSELECAAVSCPHIEECRGGCRYRAGAADSAESTRKFTGISLLRDVYKCRAYGYNDDRTQGKNPL